MPYAEVIGEPVAQSKSPLIHKHWLGQLGLAGDYRRTHVPADRLSDFLRERRHDPDWRGCNVTVPHKAAVIAHLDHLDVEAARVRAVNCVVPAPAGLTGYNTDVEGVGAALDGLALEDGKAGLIGAGGGARAAMAYLAQRGIAEVAILVRDAAKAEPLRAMLPDARVELGGFADAARLLGGSAVVINASPLGMGGCPAMPAELIAAASASGAALFDMVYDPLETDFLAAAQGRAINGLTMLVGQASRAFELFFGRPAPPPDQTLFDLLSRDDGVEAPV
jgi:shikimate dehydrogenase